MKIKRQLLSAIVLLGLAGSVTVIARDKQEVASVKAYYYHNNSPIFSVQIRATNVDLVYQKVKTGKFGEEDFQHFSLDELKKQYRVEGEKVYLSEQLVFGTGVKLTDEEVKEVLNILYRDATGYLHFLNEFEAAVVFHNPENARYRFTNQEGLSQAELPYGNYIFDHSVDKSFELMTIDDTQETLYLGNTHPLKEGEITLSAKEVDGYHTAQIGEAVTYRIPVEQAETLSIDVSPNFVIDDINAPYTEQIFNISKTEGVNGQVVKVLPAVADILIEEDRVAVTRRYTASVDKEVSQSLASLQSTRRLDVDVTAMESAFVEVTGHISSHQDHSVTMTVTDTGEMLPVTKELTVENADEKQGIYVKRNGKYVVTPELYSNNINFVMTNGKTHELLSGSDYLLGRFEKDGKISLLEQDSSGHLVWKQTDDTKDSDLSHLETNFRLEGNKTYYLDGYQQALPFQPDLWAYDEPQQSESHQALFKLRGLAAGYTYFVKQVSAPKGYVVSSDIQTFTVSPDSDQIAQFGDYQVNGYIMDMAYGENEYNALPTVRSGESRDKVMNPTLMAGVFIGAVILIVTGIGYVGIRKG